MTIDYCAMLSLCEICGQDYPGRGIVVWRAEASLKICFGCIQVAQDRAS